MDIIEHRDEWQQKFEQGWLAHFEATGEKDWSRYNRPTNEEIPAGPGLDPRGARVVLISTAGGYLKDSQEPFDAANPLGDYGLRIFPASTPFDHIAFAHDHYKHDAVDKDPQVLLPLRLLEDLEQAGEIGQLADSVISLMGYQPIATRVVDETIPGILAEVEKVAAQAALLVPA